MTTAAARRFHAIQDECRKQNKPLMGEEFLRVAERLNESLTGKGTEAYRGVKLIIERSREYIRCSRP